MIVSPFPPSVHSLTETRALDTLGRMNTLGGSLTFNAGPDHYTLNTIVDAVLQTLHTYANARPIIVSSRSPDVCLMLALKQPHYPVFFSTSAGMGCSLSIAARAYEIQSLFLCVTRSFTVRAYGIQSLLLCVTRSLTGRAYEIQSLLSRVSRSLTARAYVRVPGGLIALTWVNL